MRDSNTLRFNGKFAFVHRHPWIFPERVGKSLGVLLVFIVVFTAAEAARAKDIPAPWLPRDTGIVLCSGAYELPVAWGSVSFRFNNGQAVFYDTTEPPRALQDSQTIECRFAPVELADGGRLEAIVLFLCSDREDVVRKWARFRVTGTAAPRLLEEVVLASFPLEQRAARMLPGETQSYPVFLDGFFAGIEFPIAATRIENDTLIVAHRPGWTLLPDMWHETRKAVFGVAEPGEEMRAFRRYLSAHRPPPGGIHINYNSWWTSSCPYYTETEILELMRTFDEHMYRPYGVAFDTFCIDMGWSDPKSLWAIDPKLFPKGFSLLQEAAQRMQSRLGLWISPSCCYPTALDIAWARENGYEALKDRLCLGGPKYAAAFRDRLVEYATRDGVRHFKFDGYALVCPETDHGHAPGLLSAEAIADGLIAAAAAIHQAAPDAWIEPTCFGWNPSPWWLFHFNSVIGSFGDDAPHGRVPSPVYRESYTTARDFFNLQGAQWNPMPQAAQEVLGIIHQTNDPFLNDAVMTVLRGHQFLPVYLNPKFMDAPRWKAFADVLSWARKHQAMLEDTEPLLPPAWQDGACPKFDHKAAMPREPYGYRHRSGEGDSKSYRELIVLRNPWIAPHTYVLPMEYLPEETIFSATSAYPELRLYGRAMKRGDALNVPLMPYETVVLDIAAQSPENVPAATELTGNRIDVETVKRMVERHIYDDEAAAFGPDWTSLVGSATECIHARFDATVSVRGARADLLILFDGAKQSAETRVMVDGQAVALTSCDSETGWAASGFERPEHWCFLRAPFPEGRHDVSLTIEGITPGVHTSAWVWAWQEGQAGAVGDQDLLPQPERVSLDGQAIVPPTNLADVSGKAVHAQRPIERIDGVFLDALEPVEATQGWGTLQRNQSVWEKPITIAGTLYRRGLGTHAPSRIVYALDGRHKRFQAWAGADSATGPTITFEVWVDGTKRWESGLMKRDDPAKRVDLDVTDAKRLELIVGDGGNDLMADHADWADARLLR
ncbi:MAG TPA: NPCBM/NEW2 domain-containing protein [Candidatus Hydrogenedentes bacterium]|nr:NPCBM/NEW2 domain-containing protein [Candidatus Hydrogenedentota bacterium]